MIELFIRGSSRPALIDDSFRHFVGLGWRLDMKGYVIRFGSKKIKLHRAVMGKIPNNLFVDHINRDKLDCRLENLRLVTPAQSNQNTSKRNGPIKSNKTGYRGVFFDKERHKFIAQAGRKKIGRFDTAGEANKAVLEYRALNMPFSVEV